MRKAKEGFDRFLKMVNEDPELKKVLERYSLLLMREQKQKCSDSFKLVNLKEHDGDVYIKVKDAQADIIEAKLVFDYPVVRNEKILSKIFGWFKW